MKQLYRNSIDGYFAGVFQGLGEYINLDPTLLRVLYVVAAIYTWHIFVSILIYLVISAIVPDLDDGEE